MLLVRIANREDSDPTTSDLDLHCLSRSFWQATSVRNFRAFTVIKISADLFKTTCLHLISFPR